MKRRNQFTNTVINRIIVDKTLKKEMQEMVKDAKFDSGESSPKKLVKELEWKLQEYFEGEKDYAISDSGIYSDLLEEAIYAVEWEEVAKYILKVGGGK